MLPKELVPPGCTLESTAVARVVMVRQEASAGLGNHSGLFHLDGRDISYMGKQSICCGECGPSLPSQDRS